MKRSFALMMVLVFGGLGAIVGFLIGGLVVVLIGALVVKVTGESNDMRWYVFSMMGGFAMAFVGFLATAIPVARHYDRRLEEDEAQ